MTAFFTMAFAPNLLDAVRRVWGQAAFSEETGMYLGATGFLLNNFGAIILATLVLSGIIMYAKIKYFSNDFS